MLRIESLLKEEGTNRINNKYLIGNIGIDPTYYQSGYVIDLSDTTASVTNSVLEQLLSVPELNALLVDLHKISDAGRPSWRDCQA